MHTPRMDGFRVKQTIGSGVCGTAYAADNAGGEAVVIKVFEGMAIHRALWLKMTARLEAGGWPAGVLPVLAADFDARPAYCIYPDCSDEDGRPNNLQFRWGIDETVSEWDLLRELAQALSHMHNRQVAHGNLKPSNIFRGKTGELCLTDWTLGNMPGIAHIGYTDAFLYQAPEQLLHPEGYLEEAGYRWDVYAFGTLAFRLLCGIFPRCDETFHKVAPAWGDAKRENIVADTPRIAMGLQSSSLAAWPAAAANPREQAYRDLIQQCLHLEAQERPANMAEVSRRFEEIDFRYDAEEHRDQLLDRQRRSRHLVSLLTVSSAALLAASVFLGMDAWRSKRDWKQEVSTRTAEAEVLKKTAADAIEQKNLASAQREKEVVAAVTAQKKSEQELVSQRTQWIEKIRASREVGDQLFHWALGKGHRDLPPLDGREERLRSLDSYYQQFLRESALLPELAEERARAQLQLAEISLALGDGKTAGERLELALSGLEKYEHDTAWSLRIATDRLLLTLLWHRAGDPRSAEGFAKTRQTLAALPKTGADLDRMKQLEAVLDYHEAKLLADKGQPAKALEQLMRASTQLNALADVRPEVTVLRSELAHCYLNSADILEGMGQMGDARETRVLAVNELLTLLKTKPKDFSLRLELASTYAAMAETAMLAGDVTSADQLSQNSIKMLEPLLREQPENALVITRLASQRIVVASLLEDRGEVSQARAAVENGIKLLGSLVAKENPSPLAVFHYARLLWEKGRIAHASGNKQGGIALYHQALERFQPLAAHHHGELRTEHVLRHMGYLHSEIGHASQLEKNMDQARQGFSASLAIWQDLLRQHPQHQEYRELRDWCQSRLKEL